MNRYQKAYNIIDDYVYFNSITEKDKRFKELTKALVILNELAEKATPKKPIKHDKPDPKYGTIYSCPNCNLIFLGLHGEYCFHCGQRIDWSEEE